MKTALRLPDYEDILPPKDIYSLIALTAYYNKHYGQCSRAFIKLETLPDADSSMLTNYQDLALDIFVKYAPSPSPLFLLFIGNHLYNVQAEQNHLHICPTHTHSGGLLSDHKQVRTERSTHQAKVRMPRVWRKYQGLEPLLCSVRRPLCSLHRYWPPHPSCRWICYLQRL